MFTIAIVRKPGNNFAQGITTSHLGTPDYSLMVKQHQEYIKSLESIGMGVYVLEAELDYPDAYFVEDVAVVTPEIAIITNPGAPARNGEQEFIEPILAQLRPTIRIEAPGTLDGGDVLMVGQHYFIGISERTNLEGARQLGGILEHLGNKWTPVEVGAGLHLKSSVNYIGNDMLLMSKAFYDRVEYEGYRKISVPQNEVYAANTLWINDHLIMPLGFPETKLRLAETGLPISELDVSEAQKMDGGLTCMSIRL